MEIKDITDFKELYASFMRLNPTPKQIDIQIVGERKKEVEERE